MRVNAQGMRVGCQELPDPTTTMNAQQSIQEIGWKTPSACSIMNRTLWRRVQVGGGHLIVAEDGLRLALAGARRGRYADAMISDYFGLARRRYPWRPPLRMTVRAREARARVRAQRRSMLTGAASAS